MPQFHAVPFIKIPTRHFVFFGPDLEARFLLSSRQSALSVENLRNFH